MRILKTAKPFATSDPYYDLANGYIKLDEIVNETDAKKIRKSLKVIEDFFDSAEKREIMCP